MDSIDIAIDEVRVKGVICPKCGGYGGEQLSYRAGDNDEGWMPCYYCGNSGYISYAQWMEEIDREESEFDQKAFCNSEFGIDGAGRPLMSEY